MKKIINNELLVLVASVSVLTASQVHAKSPVVVQPAHGSDSKVAELAGLLPSVSSLPDFLKFDVNARIRYEARGVQGNDFSHAGTFRIRPGFTLFPDHALNFYAQTEHTYAFVDDFTVANAALDPFNVNNTPVLDPETNELNQLFAKYQSHGLTAKVGRQTIILDNAAFVGNLAWRQNEQTYDAAALSYEKNGFKAYYAYVNQVNRIFGSDASGPLGELDGDAHLVNLSYTQDWVKAVGYAYFLDFSDQGAGFPTNASSNTYGGYVDLKQGASAYRLEVAYQTEAGSNDDFDALYTAASYSTKIGPVGVSAGIERLEDGFVTPLSTVHLFNGYADAFIAERLGLTDVADGLTDLHLKAHTKLGHGFMMKAAVHHYRDESFSADFGWEGNLVVAKHLSESAKLVGKFAYFVGDDDGPFADDVRQFSVQLDYSF